MWSTAGLQLDEAFCGSRHVSPARYNVCNSRRKFVETKIFERPAICTYMRGERYARATCRFGAICRERRKSARDFIESGGNDGA